MSTHKGSEAAKRPLPIGIGLIDAVELILGCSAAGPHAKMLESCGGGPAIDEAVLVEPLNSGAFGCNPGGLGSRMTAVVFGGIGADGRGGDSPVCVDHLMLGGMSNGPRPEKRLQDDISDEFSDVGFGGLSDSQGLEFSSQNSVKVGRLNIC